jgi:hypothetical protein
MERAFVDLTTSNKGPLNRTNEGKRYLARRCPKKILLLPQSEIVVHT